tara:strand:- start:95 stop:409 length:315 start_codon:yes stop_codon:yes gene_type:complete
MAIIVTKMLDVMTEDGYMTQEYPEFCIIKSHFCYDQDDGTFATIGLGGGTEITKAQLHTRALEIHAKVPFLISSDPDLPNPLRERTTAEVETMVDDWCEEKNVS